MTMSPEGKPMKLYRAIYREDVQVERKLDMYARGLAHATSSAAYLMPKGATLVRVYENPDW